MTLHVHFSNRFEALSEALGKALSGSGSDPFAVDTVIVPSIAVRRRVTLDLARRHGVCANVRFDYLGAWLWRQAATLRQDVLPRSPFDPDLLAWMVYDALGDARWLRDHPRLERYVGRTDPAPGGIDTKEARETKATLRYELAQRIARLLTDYTTWRSDWLELWQRGERLADRTGAGGRSRGAAGARAAPDEALSRGAKARAEFSRALSGRDPATLDDLREDERWLASLWARIARALDLPATNPLMDFAGALAQPSINATPALPDRVHVFALPSMPPLHVEVLGALGRTMRVDLYLLNPCREYWLDIVSEKYRAHMERQGLAHHAEVGHRLLAGWGGQARAQLSGVIDRLEPDVEDDDYRVPEGDTLLARLQRSILDLDDPSARSVIVQGDDRSIELQVCHSRVRELEVLHARLLALFRDTPGLVPSQVLVAMPDLEESAPLIEAVFGTVPPERHIPYVVTGLPGSRSNPVAQALLEVLEFARSRWQASDLHALLARPRVADRFGLDETAVEQLRDWIDEAGLRWGADAAHREELGLPSERAHTAADALERLFLSYALPEDADTPWQARLPAGDVEGLSARALGALWRFIDRLRALRAAMVGERTARQWAACFEQTLQTFIAPARDEAEARHAVAAALRAFAASVPAPMVDTPLPVEVALLALRERLDVSSPGGVPSGSVTFASMKDLRAVPFEVVCLIGLDGGVFPATDRPLEFDLMASVSRAGDRQRRADDRNTFLDLVLSARRVLHLSHTGRGQRDNAVRPPSVLVSELLDWVAAVTVPEGVAAESSAGARVRERLEVVHPLQPFSAQAFGLVPDADPRLMSFDREFAQALDVQRGVPNAAPAQAIVPPRGRAVLHAAEVAENGESPVATGAPADDEQEGDTEAQDSAGTAAALRALPPFFDRPLPTPGPEWREVTTEQLIEFLQSPARYLLRHRMQLSIDRAQSELENTEPFELDRRASRAIASRLVPVLVARYQGLTGEAGSLRGAGAGRDAASDTAAHAHGPSGATEPADDASLAIAQALARAGTELPHGVIGDVLADEAARRSRALAAQVVRARGVGEAVVPETSIRVDIAGEPWTLIARPGEVWPGGVVHWKADKAYESDLIEAWVRHLALCAEPPKGCALRTTLIEPQGGWTFVADVQASALAASTEAGEGTAGSHAEGSDASSNSSIACEGNGASQTVPPEAVRNLDPAQAREALSVLVCLYARGLCEPQAFFPKSTFAYAAKAAKASNLRLNVVDTSALKDAVKAWHGVDFDGTGRTGERDDAWLRVAWRGLPDPVSEKPAEFVRLAREVCGPLLAWRRERGGEVS